MAPLLVKFPSLAILPPEVAAQKVNHSSILILCIFDIFVNNLIPLFLYLAVGLP